MKKTPVGKVTHFFDKISVAVIELTNTLKKGDKISIEGTTSNFEQVINSMQIDHKEILEAKKKQSIGMKTAQPVKVGDLVFKITE